MGKLSNSTLSSGTISEPDTSSATISANRASASGDSVTASLGTLTLSGNDSAATASLQTASFGTLAVSTSDVTASASVREAIMNPTLVSSRVSSTSSIREGSVEVTIGANDSSSSATLSEPLIKLLILAKRVSASGDSTPAVLPAGTIQANATMRQAEAVATNIEIGSFKITARGSTQESIVNPTLVADKPKGVVNLRTPSLPVFELEVNRINVSANARKASIVGGVRTVDVNRAVSNATIRQASISKDIDLVANRVQSGASIREAVQTRGIVIASNRIDTRATIREGIIEDLNERSIQARRIKANASAQDTIFDSIEQDANDVVAIGTPETASVDATADLSANRVKASTRTLLPRERVVRVSDELNLRKVHTVDRTRVKIDKTTDSDTEVRVETKLDDGDWKEVQDGDTIPGISEGDEVYDSTLKIRQILESNDSTKTPTLNEMDIAVFTALE